MLKLWFAGPSNQQTSVPYLNQQSEYSLYNEQLSHSVVSVSTGYVKDDSTGCVFGSIHE